MFKIKGFPAIEPYGSNGMEKQNSKSKEAVPEDTVTVDAVHPRLLNKSSQQQPSRLTSSDEVAYCIQCEESIVNTVAAIRNHFLRTPHESLPCLYCHGPAYKYISRSEKIYHECILNVAQEEDSNNSDSSSLSKDKDIDSSETESTSSAKNIKTAGLLCEKNTDSHSLNDFSNVENT